MGIGETVRPLRVLIVSASMGAGHSGIAAELTRQLSDRGHQSRTVDFIDALPMGYGEAMRSVYRAQLRYAPWTYDAMYRLRFRYPHLWGEINTWYRLLSEHRLLEWVADSDADVVLSVYPLASAVLGELRRRERLSIPVVTYITDLGVHPLWVSPSVDLHLAVHPEAAWQAAQRAGGAACTCAPLVRPAFLDSIDRDQARARLGFGVDDPLALVVAGSWGVGQIERTVEAVAAAGFHPITVCGSHSMLYRRLTELGLGTTLAWTEDMPALMAAADVLVENAGGLSCMEAFAAGLPVVTYRPIAGHGRHNAQEMDRAGLTVWAKTADEFDEALRRIDDRARTGGRHSPRSLFATQPVASVIETVCATKAMTAPRPAPIGGGAAMVLKPAGKVVVTGGSVRFGADLVDDLTRAGQQVTIIDPRVPDRIDTTYWAVRLDDLDGLIMATAGADEVYHVPGVATADPADTERVWDACRRNGVTRTVLVDGPPERLEAMDRPAVGLDRPGPSLAAPAVAAASGRAEVFAATLAGAGLAVLLMAGLVPGSGTPLLARVIATVASVAAAGAAWLQARRFALAMPTVIGAAGALTAVWLLSQSTGGLSTIVSGVLLGLFVGVMFARLPTVPGPVPRRATMATAAILLTVGVVAYPALSWLAAALALAGPSAVLLGGPLPSWSGYRKAWWVTASSVVALTTVLASWVAANSAGANVANHGPRGSQEVAITFDGSSDNATMQRLVGILNANQAQATFFVSAPVLQAAPQVGTLVLSRNQLLANEAGPHDWGAWLDPGYRQLTRDQRVFAEKAGVCPTFFEWPGGQTSPMMAAAVRRHGMTIVSPDVRSNGRGDLAGVVHRVLTQARPGSIIALRLGAKGAAKTMATSTVVQAVPQILQGLQLRGLRPVALDQLLHVAPYTSRC